MLTDNPHMDLTAALEDIDDSDGWGDRLGTIWTYTHTIFMDGDKVEIINMTERVKEMNKESILDREHNRAVTNGLKEMQS